MDISNPEQEIFSNLDPELERDIDPLNISEFPNADDIATCPSTDNSIHDISIEPVGSSNCEEKFDLQSDLENGQSIFDKTSQDSESYKENILKCLDQLTEDVRNELAKKTDGIVIIDLEDESMDNSTEDNSSKDEPQQHRFIEADNIVPVNLDETLDISTKDSLEKDKPQQHRSNEVDKIVTVNPDETLDISTKDSLETDKPQQTRSEADEIVTVDLEDESMDISTEDNSSKDKPQQHRSKEVDETLDISTKDSLEKDKPQPTRSKEADKNVTVNLDEEIMENSFNDNSSKDKPQKEAKDKVAVNLDGETIDNSEDDNDDSAKDHSSKDKSEPTGSKEAENVATEEMIEKSEKDISVKDTLHKVTLNDENVAIEVSDDISSTADNDVITLDESDDSSNDSSFQKYDISSKRKRRCDVLDISTDASQFDDDTSRFGDEIVLSDGDDDCVDISNETSGNFLFNGWRYRSRI